MFKKNTAVVGFKIGLISKTDNSDITTGTPVGYYTIDDGTQLAIADVTPVHKGNGEWAFDLTAAEMNGDVIGLTFTHPSAITVHKLIRTTDQLVDDIWDEVLTGVTHNIKNSAAKRLRDIAANIVHTGTSQGPAINGNQIILAADASDVDGAYDPALISIIDGTGIGQTRLILQYDGATRTVTVDRNWKVNPDITSEYTISGDAGREHVNEGLAQGGGLNTITLNALASDIDDVYRGHVIFLRSGTGEDQADRIVSYDGTTKIATVTHDWVIIPDSTTGYVMLPTSMIHSEAFAESVWNALGADYLVAGSFGEMMSDILKLTGHKVTYAGGIITIYEADGSTVWRQYDLSNHGRTQV